MQSLTAMLVPKSPGSKAPSDSGIPQSSRTLTAVSAEKWAALSAQEPALGLLGAALQECDWVAHPKEATHDGQSPPGNNSRGSVAHHRTCLAAVVAVVVVVCHLRVCVCPNTCRRATS